METYARSTLQQTTYQRVEVVIEPRVPAINDSLWLLPVIQLQVYRRVVRPAGGTSQATYWHDTTRTRVVCHMATTKIDHIHK